MAFPFIILNLVVFATCLAAAQALETFPVPSGGPESLIFGPSGELYTGVNDGSIVRSVGPSLTEFTRFVHASPTWTKEQCEGKNDPSLGFVCGRTLGLGLHRETQKLYLADAYHGISVVDLKTGGPAKILLTEVAGLPLKWLDGMDVDQNTGFVYVTDVSTKYNFSEVGEHLARGDSTGRVVEFDPKTGNSRVLATGLAGVGGVGCSKDSSFVLFSELLGGKITKYWLEGPKKDTSEVILTRPFLANIKLTKSGDFWITTNINNVGTALKIDENGNILEENSFDDHYKGAFIQEAHEHHGKLYVSSLSLDYIGVYEPGQGKHAEL